MVSPVSIILKTPIFTKTKYLSVLQSDRMSKLYTPLPSGISELTTVLVRILRKCLWCTGNSQRSNQDTYIRY